MRRFGGHLAFHGSRGQVENIQTASSSGNQEPPLVVIAQFPNHAVSVAASRRGFLTIEQIAEELNVSVAQVRALLKSGDLGGIQVGGRNVWRIGAIDVEDYIAEAYKGTAEHIAVGGLPDCESTLIPFTVPTPA